MTGPGEQVEQPDPRDQAPADDPDLWLPEPPRRCLMTGPDHYREAERLLAEAVDVNGVFWDQDVPSLSAAQVHATLALAAAVASTDTSLRRLVRRVQGWPWTLGDDLTPSEPDGDAS